MGGGGGTQESTTRTELSPEFKPYVNFALQQARGIYEGMPQAPETLAVAPSAATQQALQMAQERAMAGSPLLQAAQQQNLAMVQGQGVNPFLAGALQAAYQPTIEAQQEAFRGLQSQLSSAGRYGSDAGAQLAQRAGAGFGRAIGDIQNQMAFASAEAERNRQQRAVETAPTLAAQDYSDIQRLLQAGQGAEAYQQQAIQGQLAAQNIPFERLQRAANVFYGAPLETTSTQKATPQGGK